MKSGVDCPRRLRRAISPASSSAHEVSLLRDFATNYTNYTNFRGLPRRRARIRRSSDGKSRREVIARLI
jgi:hypothetical protein